MPQLSPLPLAFPQKSELELAHHNSVRGPKDFLKCLQEDQWLDIKKGIEKLFASEQYKKHSPQHYWYRIENSFGNFEGILTGVQIDEKHPSISTHEGVLTERVALFSNYLSAIQQQAEPLLLVHESPGFSVKLKEQVCAKAPNQSFSLGKESHQLWVIPPSEAKALEEFAVNTQQFHLADGHHRLASTKHWAAQQQQQGFVFSFLLASDQLKNDSFLWALKTPELPKDLSDFFIDYDPDYPLWVQTQQGIYSIAVPPEKNAVLYLYHQVLEQSIDSISNAIDYFPQGTLSSLQQKDYAAVFGYKSLLVEEIITIAKQGKRLPPKSTYLQPKLPTGLFLAPLSVT